MALTQEDILGRRGKFRFERVYVPEFDDHVYVRQGSVLDRDMLEDALKATTDKNIRARIVAIYACDSAGLRLFNESHIPAIGELPASAIEPIVDAAMRLNGMRKQDAEVLEKNSATTPT